jgi:hypothetical protein
MISTREKFIQKWSKIARFGQASFTSVKTIPAMLDVRLPLGLRSCICPEKHSLNRAMYPMRNNTKK